MKGEYMRRFLCLIALVLSLLTLSGCMRLTWQSIDCVADPQETPISAFYEDYPTAKNPWNMKLCDGILYFATGDYGSNSGNTPIFAYDTKNERWIEPFITSDEALDAFRTVGDTLFAVGNDSTEEGFRGNYYELTANGWVAHKNLSGAVHVFDVIDYGGARFFGIGTDDTSISPVIRDDGTRRYLPFLKNGENRLLQEDFDFSRVYNFFVADGELYAFFFAPHIDTQKMHTYEFYKYDGESFCYVSTFEDLPIKFLGVSDGEKSKFLRQNFFTYEFSRGGSAYFTSGFLYKTRDFLNVEKIPVPGDDVVSDLLCFKGECYVLTFSRNDRASFANTVWRLNDDDSMTKIISFRTLDAYALSFEYDGDKFYVALGNRANTEDVGSLCIVNSK